MTNFFLQVEECAKNILSRLRSPEESIEISELAFNYHFKKTEMVFKFISWLFYIAGASYVYEKTKDTWVLILIYYLKLRIVYVVSNYLVYKLGNFSFYFTVTKSYTFRILFSFLSFIFVIYIYIKIDNYIFEVLVPELEKKI